MKDTNGFTLIELLITLAILSILAAIAFPNYLNYLAKAQQAEAKSNLGAIYVGMLSYRPPKSAKVMTGYEGATLQKIGFEINGAFRYRYTLVSVSVNTFKARANGISGQIAGDVWEIDQDRELVDLDPERFNQ